MHLEEIFRRSKLDFSRVSILVSIWMHLEGCNLHSTVRGVYGFNPSFYLDASGSLEAFRQRLEGFHVSILVSIWMHLEESLAQDIKESKFSFQS